MRIEQDPIEYERDFVPVTMTITFETGAELASLWLYLLKDSTANGFKTTRDEYCNGARSFPDNLFTLWKQVKHAIMAQPGGSDYEAWILRQSEEA